MSLLAAPCRTYPLWRGDEGAQVAVLHERHDDEGSVVGDDDAEQRQHVRVVEAVHDGRLLQELRHTAHRAHVYNGTCQRRVGVERGLVRSYNGSELGVLCKLLVPTTAIFTVVFHRWCGI